MARESTIDALRKRIRELERQLELRPAEDRGNRRPSGDAPQAREWLQVLSEHTQDAILICDAAGKPQFFNKAYARAMKELLGLDMKTGVQPHKLLDDPEAVAYWDGLHRRVLRGEKFSAEFSHCVGEQVRHFEHVFCPIERDGSIAGFSEVTREITQRVEAEAARRASEEDYRSIFNAVRDSIFIFDYESLAVLDANDFACETYGYSRDELKQMRATEISAEPEKSLDVIRSERSFIPQRRHRKKDGTVFPVEVSVNYHHRGGRKIMTALMRDISRRKQSQEALQESQKKFRNVVESSPMGVHLYRLQPGGRLIFDGANQAANRILGVDHAEFVGKPIEDVFPPLAETDIPDHYRRVCSTGTSWQSEQVEYEHETIRGAYEVYAFQTSPNHMAVFFLDITQRKRDEMERQQLEDQLRQAQKMEAVGTLAGGIAHDFNNLLMAILGNASLLLEEIDSTHAFFDRIKSIEASAQSGADLTRQLLGFARRGTVDVSATDLNALLERNLTTFGRTRKEIEIQRRFQSDLWPVEVDRGQIEQVVLNLCVNASQAMPDGGKLTVATRNVAIKNGGSTPAYLEPGRYVLLSITDTGVGMDPEVQKRIFEPFFTTKEMGRGTGLGLATVYGIVKSHGGAIHVDSRKGVGTTFSVTLPSTRKPISIVSPESSQKSSGRETVLIVDDEAAILDVTAKMLRHLGYQVLTAHDGMAAVDLMRRTDEPVDLVVLDVIMPKLSGGKTFDHLRALRPDLKILLSSGYNLDGEVAEILARGCNGFIQKPFNIHQLAQKIREILDAVKAPNPR